MLKKHYYVKMILIHSYWDMKWTKLRIVNEKGGRLAYRLMRYHSNREEYYFKKLRSYMRSYQNLHCKYFIRD